VTEPARDIELVCGELDPALGLLERAGLRLDCIYPADDPHTALLTDGRATVRLTSEPGAAPPPAELPPFQPEFVLTPASDGARAGRAGMLYRDLIPGRLGGRYIASHITTPDGGPVADWVHYHRIAFQLIYVRAGWVRVVYQDQGAPFVMHPGDLVLQPPGIRHQVLESSPGLEVIEVGCPALHATFADHQLALPTATLHAKRDFGGQRFVRHIAAQTPWTRFRGAEAQETAVAEATGGIADARTLRPAGSPVIELPPHDGELQFGFVVAGAAELDHGAGHRLRPGDAFVIPPSEGWRLADASPDLRLFLVTTGGGIDAAWRRAKSA
jgi:quercetin dioxygenase-like cupin family protein